MSVTTIREGLAANLSAIPEVQVSAYILASAPVGPRLQVFPSNVEYDMTMGSRRSGKHLTDEYTFTVQGMVPLNEDIGNQQALDRMLDSSGPTSVKTAIEADKTLGGACDSLYVSSEAGIQLATSQSMPLLLAEWTVTIISSEVAT